MLCLVHAVRVLVHAVSHNVQFCPRMSFHPTPQSLCPTVPCYALSYTIMSCSVIQCPAMVSCCVLQCPAVVKQSCCVLHCPVCCRRVRWSVGQQWALTGRPSVSSRWTSPSRTKMTMPQSSTTTTTRWPSLRTSMTAPLCPPPSLRSLTATRYVWDVILQSWWGTKQQLSYAICCWLMLPNFQYNDLQNTY